MAKATYYFYPDAEIRKHGDQTGLETLVVHAVTYECWTKKFRISKKKNFHIFYFLFLFKLTRKHSAWVLQSQDWNSKELTEVCTSGGASGLMRYNAQNLTNFCIITSSNIVIKFHLIFYEKGYYRCCMAVVSPCLEMFG